VSRSEKTRRFAIDASPTTAVLASTMAEPDGERVERLPVAERAELLALVRRIRGALPAGPSALRELVVELESRLEARAGEAANVG
jgi:hypothetical protein